MDDHNPSKLQAPLDKRLEKIAREFQEAARRLPSGPQRDLLLKKVNQTKTALDINKWLASNSLETPNKKLQSLSDAHSEDWILISDVNVALAMRQGNFKQYNDWETILSGTEKYKPHQT